MIIFFTIIASLAGAAIVACICLQTASPDAGFSAALGGGGRDAGSRKSGTDLLLEKVLKTSAVVWIVACLIIALLGAHPTIGG